MEYPQGKFWIFNDCIMDAINQRENVEHEVDQRVPKKRSDFLLHLFLQFFRLRVVFPRPVMPLAPHLVDDQDVGSYHDDDYDVEWNVPEDKAEVRPERKTRATAVVKEGLAANPAPRPAGP